MRRFYIVCALLVGLMAVPVLAQDIPSNVEWVDCWMELPEDLVEGESLDCGYLSVPENRSDPASPMIQLAFGILYATADQVQPDPVIYLAGGPGGNAVAELAEWVDTTYLQDRDLILLDQRGTGYSLPSLNCPESEDEMEDATQACRDRLVSEGVNLQAYNSAENAADVADLRVALGYDEWNLYGISYGTRLALTVMRDYPEGVRSVVIDSVYPPEVNSWEEYGQNIADEFNALFAACAADAACDAAYPNLDQLFNEVVEQLNAEPAEYVGIDPSSGDEIDQTMSGDDFIDRLFQMLYATTSIPYFPWVISEVANGNYVALDEAEAGGASEGGFKQAPDEDVSDSEGMNLSVECQEEVAFLDENLALDNVPDAGTPLHNNSILSIQSTFSDCAIWGVKAADPKEAQPVVSDIPTLVTAGEFDPITPPKWAESAASHLPNSFYFLIPGGGHGVVDTNECTTGIMQAFLDNPTAEPDGSCINEIGSVAWVLPS